MGAEEVAGHIVTEEVMGRCWKLEWHKWMNVEQRVAGRQRAHTAGRPRCTGSSYYKRVAGRAGMEHGHNSKGYRRNVDLGPEEVLLHGDILLDS